MKKSYIQPRIKAIDLVTERILSGSTDLDDRTQFRPIEDTPYIYGNEGVDVD